jgi:hypothetical protein
MLQSATPDHALKVVRLLPGQGLLLARISMLYGTEIARSGCGVAHAGSLHKFNTRLSVYCPTFAVVEVVKVSG